jgi:hypothetical protein
MLITVSDQFSRALLLLSYTGNPNVLVMQIAISFDSMIGGWALNRRFRKDQNMYARG